MNLSKMDSRVVTWRGWLRGELKFDQAVWLTLPGKWRPRPNKKETMFLGERFLIPSGDYRNFFELVNQISCADSYRIGLIKDGDVVIDAGASMGVFSALVANHYPNATIYAFEPSPLSFASLQENMKPYPNVKVFNMGLGDLNAQVPFHVDGVAVGGDHFGAGGGQTVRTVTVDSLNLDLNFMKMDTEGYEGNILKGAKETIKRNKPIIAMSAYHKKEDKVELPLLLNSMSPYNCELQFAIEEDFICTPKA